MDAHGAGKQTAGKVGSHVAAEKNREEVLQWVNQLGVANGKVLRTLTGLPNGTLDRYLERLTAERSLRCLGCAQVDRSDPLRGVWYATRRRQPPRLVVPPDLEYWRDYFEALHHSPEQNLRPLRVHTSEDPPRELDPLRLVISPSGKKAGKKGSTPARPVMHLLRRHAAWTAEVARWLMADLGAITRHTGYRAGLITERVHRMREQARLRGSGQALDPEEDDWEEGSDRDRRPWLGPRLTMVPDLFVSVGPTFACRVEVELTLKSRAVYADAHRRRLLMVGMGRPMPVLYVIVEETLRERLHARLEGIEGLTIVRYGERTALEAFLRWEWRGPLE